MNKKATLSAFSIVLLSLVLVFAVIVVASGTGLIDINAILGGENVLEIKTKGTIPGNDDLIVPVFLKNSDEVSAFQFSLNYPEFLSLKDVEKTQRVNDAFLEFNEILPGESKIAVLSSEKIKSRANPILNLVFDVSENAEPGFYNFSFSNVVLGDDHAKELSSKFKDGTLIVASGQGQLNKLMKEFEESGEEQKNPSEESENNSQKKTP